MKKNLIPNIIFWVGVAGVATSVGYTIYARKQSRDYRTKPNSGITAEKIDTIDKNMTKVTYVAGVSLALLTMGYFMSRPPVRY